MINKMTVFREVTNGEGAEVEVAEFKHISSIQIGQLEISELPNGELCIAPAVKMESKSMAIHPFLKSTESAPLMDKIGEIHISQPK